MVAPHGVPAQPAPPPYVPNSATDHLLGFYHAPPLEPPPAPLGSPMEAVSYASRVRSQTLTEDIANIGRFRAAPDSGASTEPTHAIRTGRSSVQAAQGRPVSAQITQLRSTASAMQSQLDGLIDGLDSVDLQIENMSRDNKCCICLTGTHDSQLLPCMHNRFCKACLEQHLARDNHCPVCRAAVRGMLTSFG